MTEEAHKKHAADRKKQAASEKRERAARDKEEKRKAQLWRALEARAITRLQAAYRGRRGRVRVRQRAPGAADHEPGEGGEGAGEGEAEAEEMAEETAGHHRESQRHAIARELAEERERLESYAALANRTREDGRNSAPLQRPAAIAAKIEAGASGETEAAAAAAAMAEAMAEAASDAAYASGERVIVELRATPPDTAAAGGGSGGSPVAVIRLSLRPRRRPSPSSSSASFLAPPAAQLRAAACEVAAATSTEDAPKVHKEVGAVEDAVEDAAVEDAAVEDAVVEVVVEEAVVVEEEGDEVLVGAAGDPAPEDRPLSPSPPTPSFKLRLQELQRVEEDAEQEGEEEMMPHVV